MANLVPILGVIFMDWDLALIMVLYWAENGVIGIYHLVKLKMAGYNTVGLLFFLMHYGVFWTVHGAFMIGLFVEGNLFDSEFMLNFLLGLTFLFVSHGVSYMTNFVANEEYKRNRGKLFMQPYTRVVILHLAILFGAFLALGLGQGMGPLIVLIIGKTVVDIFAHLKSHHVIDIASDQKMSFKLNSREINTDQLYKN